MRNYTIVYLAEINDECADLDHPVSANNITLALDKFKTLGIVHKRILSISEVHN